VGNLDDSVLDEIATYTVFVNKVVNRDPEVGGDSPAMGEPRCKESKTASKSRIRQTHVG